MEDRPVNIAVIGCGQIVRDVNLPVPVSLPGVRVTVLADTDAPSRERAARLVPHATFVETANEAAASEVDAVLIAVPTGVHAAAALTVLRHRKHVYVEKPLATSIAEAQPVPTEWRSAGVTRMIGFNYRRNPLFEQTRDIIRSGRLGEILRFRSVFSPAMHPIPAWKQSHGTGGVLLDLGSYHIDLLTWLLDCPVVRVSATVRSLRSEADTAKLAWHWKKGITAHSFFSLTAVDENWIEVTGPAGKLAVDHYRSPRLQVGFSRIAAFVPGAYTVQRWRSPGLKPSYWRALKEFIAAIRGGLAGRADLMDGCRSLSDIRVWPQQRHLMPQIIPLLVVSLIAHAVGEMLGNLFGLRRTEETYLNYETDRLRHVTTKDWGELIGS